ncbi:MAG: DUF2937 family protein [Stellaceae bacterium]
MRLITRWLSRGLGLGFALLCGVLAMQAPAFTDAYGTALLQVAADARRDIDQREDSARQYYGIAAREDDALIEALKAQEPSNAETLARSIAHAGRLRAAYDKIAQSPVLLRPVTALTDAADDPEGDKAAIWRLSWQSFTPRIDLSFAAMIYGFAGLMLGSLVSELVAAAVARAARRRLVPRRMS